MSRVIKNEIVIEIEDNEDDGEDGKQAAEAQNENTVLKDVNDNTNDNGGKRKRNIGTNVNLGELIIPLDRCDSDQANETPRSTRGQINRAKNAMQTLQNKRKSPRI